MNVFHRQRFMGRGCCCVHVEHLLPHPLFFLPQAGRGVKFEGEASLSPDEMRSGLVFSHNNRYDSVIYLNESSSRRGGPGEEAAHDDDTHMYDYVKTPVSTASGDVSEIELAPCSAYGAPNVRIRDKPPATDSV